MFSWSLYKNDVLDKIRSNNKIKRFKMGGCCTKVTQRRRTRVRNTNNKNSKLREDYAIGRLLGQGNFGTVHFCTHKISGQARAIKFFVKEKLVDIGLKEILNEFNILKSLDHPNIVRLYEFYEEEDRFAIVQELCKGGDSLVALKKCKKFEEKKVRTFIKTLLSVVNYYHGSNIVH